MKLLGSTGQKIMTKHYANISEVLLYSQVSSNIPIFSTNRFTNETLQQAGPGRE